MTTRNVNKQASALAKTRERRRELDKARDEQDRRVEQATATGLVAMDTRKAAELALGGDLTERSATVGLAAVAEGDLQGDDARQQVDPTTGDETRPCRDLHRFAVAARLPAVQACLVTLTIWW